MRRYVLSFGILCICAVSASAEDNSAYTLLNPTPKELMRGMATDRPDKTESPYTVDAGHYQVELSSLDYEYDHDNPDDPDHLTYAYSVLPINLKVGLLNNADLQLVINPYNSQYTRGLEDSTISGFGEMQTRLKVNIWGNDSGSSAMAIMPFIKFPTNAEELENDDVEGGVTVPIGFKLPMDLNMGFMTEFDFNRNAAEDGYHTEFINSITLSHSIIGELSGYVEFFSNVSNEDAASWVGTVDMGLTYLIKENVQLDLGLNIGVTQSAPDLNPFCGLSMRY